MKILEFRIQNEEEEALVEMTINKKNEKGETITETETKWYPTYWDSNLKRSGVDLGGVGIVFTEETEKKRLDFVHLYNELNDMIGWSTEHSDFQANSFDPYSKGFRVTIERI